MHRQEVSDLQHLPNVYRWAGSHWMLFFSLTLFLAMGWITFTGWTAPVSENANIHAPQVGFLAPEFTLSSLDGEVVSLSDFHGKVVVLNFWASWCPPCKAEMPSFEKVYQAQHYLGVEILAVNRTDQDALPAIRTFSDSYQLSFPILLDEKGEVSRLYRVTAMPTTFFIQPDGIIHSVVIGGPLPEAFILAEVQQMRAEDQ